MKKKKNNTKNNAHTHPMRNIVQLPEGRSPNLLNTEQIKIQNQSSQLKAPFITESTPPRRAQSASLRSGIFMHLHCHAPQEGDETAGQRHTDMIRVYKYCQGNKLNERWEYSVSEEAGQAVMLAGEAGEVWARH